MVWTAPVLTTLAAPKELHATNLSRFFMAEGEGGSTPAAASEGSPFGTAPGGDPPWSAPPPGSTPPPGSGGGEE